jgi:hypothetical protein
MFISETILHRNVLEKLKLLEGIPIFPQMIELLGYQGHARYITLYWDEDEDLVYNDGVDEIAGVLNKRTWLKYICSRKISGYLFPYTDLYQHRAKHGVMYDRVKGLLYAGMIDDIKQAVHSLAKLDNVVSFYATQLPDTVISNVLDQDTTMEDLDIMMKIISRSNYKDREVLSFVDKWLKEAVGGPVCPECMSAPNE